jgi:hypothetical protein
MKSALFVLCLFLVIGCASLEQMNDGSIPKLLIQTPLPPVPITLTRPVFELEIVMFIEEDGTVGKTRMLKGSGDATWDSLALTTMKQWHFTPAHMDNKPVGSWFHMKSILRYANPVHMSLAEILCTTAEEADTVYAALDKGLNFNELAMKYSVDPSREMNGVVGDVDINMYPENIRKQLNKLTINDFTKPMQYGELYAIFKRLK